MSAAMEACPDGTRAARSALLGSTPRSRLAGRLCTAGGAGLKRTSHMALLVGFLMTAQSAGAEADREVDEWVQVEWSDSEAQRFASLAAGFFALAAQRDLGRLDEIVAEDERSHWRAALEQGKPWFEALFASKGSAGSLLRTWSAFRWSAARRPILESMGAGAILCLANAYDSGPWPPPPGELRDMHAAQRIFCLNTYRFDGRRWISLNFLDEDEGDDV